MLNEETYRYIQTHRNEDVRQLALKPAPEQVDLRMALQQIEGWQTALHKLPSWATADRLLFPPRISMEQCSSEATARYKQQTLRRLLHLKENEKSGLFIDMTGGFGIDFSFLAPLFSRAVYMERQSVLCRIASHNFKVLGLKHAEVCETDSSLHPEQLPECDCCFIDPARRDTAGRKTVAIEDCEPDLTVLQDSLRQKARITLVKLSPMLDIPTALKTLRHISEVHIVSVLGECKELLLAMTQDTPQDTVCHCVNLETSQPDFTFTLSGENASTCRYAELPMQYLYEPNASVMKGKGFQSLATSYGMEKLHPNSHLYTSEEPCPDFPGRIFRIEVYAGFGKKEQKALLGGIRQANLTVRNFPNTVAELRKRLKLKEGGDTFLFATTLSDGTHVLIRCRKIR